MASQMAEICIWLLLFLLGEVAYKILVGQDLWLAQNILFYVSWPAVQTRLTSTQLGLAGVWAELAKNNKRHELKLTRLAQLVGTAENYFSGSGRVGSGRVAGHTGNKAKLSPAEACWAQAELGKMPKLSK